MTIKLQNNPLMEKTLSQAILIGSNFHDIDKIDHLSRETTGFYHYDRKEIWRTGPIAAACVGIWGPEFLDYHHAYRPALSLLSRYLGYSIENLIVEIGPTGRVHTKLSDEIMDLVDKDGWTRQDVSIWLKSCGL